ncbi:MAG: DUF5067 domain-containing protein [Oscillospiraceae bacterium]|jgi:hypothetical protein|nr:DUF5067 domain-containing protein [Oscillospiraceae bacterium]
MAFCTECGHELPEAALFCPGCGTALMPAPGGAADAANGDIQAAEGAGDTAGAAPDNTRAEQPYPWSGTEPAVSAYGYPPCPGAPTVPLRSQKKTGLIIGAVSFAVILLAAALLLLFSPGSRVGYWESVGVDTGDGVISDRYYGISVTGALRIQLNGDKSAYLFSPTSESITEGTWNESGNKIWISTPNNSFFLEYKNKQLLLREAGEIYYFDKISGHDINHPTVARDAFNNGDGGPLPDANNSGRGYVARGDYHIAVTGAERFTDIDGEDAVRIYFEFTNASGYSLSAWSALDYCALQGGDYLEENASYDSDAAYNLSRNIRPGITIQCAAEFKYDPYGGSVNFSISGYEDGERGGLVTASYLPGGFPGAPAPYVIAPVRDPQWTLNVPEAGFLDGFHVEVGDAELIEDYSGAPAIRVFYIFTNGGDYSTSLDNELYLYTYQDGIELDYTYAAEDSDTDLAFYEEIAPGETVTISSIFRLRNETSPVEAEVEAYSDYRSVGQTYGID